MIITALLPANDPTVIDNPEKKEVVPFGQYINVSHSIPIKDYRKLATSRQLKDKLFPE